jgi:voltage-gated potassium channel
MTVVRSLRLLRLFKILNHPKIYKSIRAAKPSHMPVKENYSFIYFVLISTIIIGSIMYVVGKESGLPASPPVSIGQ